MSICNLQTKNIREKLAEIRKYYEANSDSMTKEEHMAINQLLKDLKEGVTDNLGRFYAKAAAINNISEIEATIRASSIGTVFDRTKALASVSPTQTANIMSQLASVEQGMSNVFRRSKTDASAFLSLVGFDQLKVAFSQLQSAKEQFELEFSQKINSYKTPFRPLYKHFKTIKGSNELGIIAHLMRVDPENADNFSERKAQIYHSIRVLKSLGRSSNGKDALLLEIVNEMNLDSIKTREEFMEMVQSKYANHLDLVNWMSNKYEEIYEQHKEIGIEYFNVVFPKHLNYTPDTIVRVDRNANLIKLERSEGDFVDSQVDLNSGFDFVKDALSKNTELTQDYVELDANAMHSFDFVSNNNNKYTQVLKDVFLTPSLVQLNETLNSERGAQMLNKIAYDGSERTFIKNRINYAVKNMLERNTSDEVLKFAGLSRISNRMAKVATIYSLSAPRQAINQFVPTLFKTLTHVAISSTNAIGSVRHLFSAKISDDKRSFLKAHSTAAYRGISSQADVLTRGSLKEEKYYQTILKAPFRFIIDEVGEKIALNNFLIKPDRAIAERSWLTFYSQYIMESEGRQVNFASEKANQKAIAYANTQVDIMMNASLHETMGGLFTARNGLAQFIRRVLLPFGSMQQNNRNAMYGAALTLFRGGGEVNDLESYVPEQYRNSSAKRNAAAVLMSNLVEIAMFNGIRAGLAMYVKPVLEERLAALIGLSFEDDDDKVYDNAIKSMITSIASDLMPAPMIDEIVIAGLNGLYRSLGEDHPMFKKINRSLFYNKQDDIMYSKIFSKEDDGGLGVYDVVLDDAVFMSELIATYFTGDKYRGGLMEEGDKLTAKEYAVMESLLAVSILAYLVPIGLNNTAEKVYKRAKYYRREETRSFEEVLKSEEFKDFIPKENDF